MSGEILIELDERRRASLGRVGRPEHTRYLAETRDDGVIVMRPVELVPAVVGERPATLNPYTHTFDDDEVRRFGENVRRLREGFRHGLEPRPVEGYEGIRVDEPTDPIERRPNHP